MFIRALTFTLIYFLLSIQTVWACSCGGKPIAVSEFLDKAIIVKGKPEKSEYVGLDHFPTKPAMDGWWNQLQKQVKTTLTDVHTFSGVVIKKKSLFTTALMEPHAE